MKHLFCILLALTVSCAPSGAGQPEIAMPQWYSNNMVLPRNNVFSISGFAKPGKKITVQIDRTTLKAWAGEDGRWQVAAGPFVAARCVTLKISSGKSRIIYDNVAFGDIWLCSGQSNMEFEVRESSSASEAAFAADPELRFYDMKCNWRTDNVAWSKTAVDSVQRHEYYKETAWQEASPETVSRFSAIGYFFGKALRDSLKVPVGIICNAVGGSTCESWVSGDLLEAFYPEILQGSWLENELVMEWARGRARKNIGTGHGERHPYQPGYLWQAGTMPLRDCPVTGVIWYQGESNADNIPSHNRLFPLLVDSFRSVFGEVPFYYAQLSSLNRPSWPAFRESQAALEQCRTGLGMIVTTDLGEWTEVHYRNKKPAGERFAALALERFYGK